MSWATELAAQPFATLAERSPEAASALQNAPPEFLQSAQRVLASSDFMVDALARDERLLPALLAQAPRNCDTPLPVPVPRTDDEAEFMAALRRWRRAELARIAWRDLAGWARLPETLLQLSNAADLAIQAAAGF